jgi:ABC-type dipeptide/oligopeptide/nickel transport system permease component
MSITLVMSFMYSLTNLVVDIVYVYLNPKVSYE